MKQPEQTKEEKTAEQIADKFYNIFLHGNSEYESWHDVLIAMSQDINTYASQKCKALQEENERLKEDLAQRNRTLDFYRQEMKKLGDYLEANKIGKANQKFLDAIYDHIIEQKDRIQVLEEALLEARTFITEADDDGEGKEDWIILKTIEQALTGSQSKD